MKFDLYENEKVIITMAVLGFLAELQGSEAFDELCTEDVMMPLVQDGLGNAKAKALLEYWEETPEEMIKSAIALVKKLK